MTLTDTERRIVAMIEAEASKFQAAGDSAVAAGNDRKARDMFAGKIALTAAANAIRSRQHKDARYD